MEGKYRLIDRKRIKTNMQMITKAKGFFGRKNFSDDEEVKGTVEKWLREVEREVNSTDIQKVSRLQKCI
ncbi:hypothetical protein J437_LFUL013649 [Ladona fulva]|uniref:Uncharacterized protein n=1 Tax=Ladona fulva TaxID=123851 RepID=A0A8K0P2L5_LADFU|nr:hypothetical protein J437_LFUL013649 [Ladona fulva]